MYIPNNYHIANTLEFSRSEYSDVKTYHLISYAESSAETLEVVSLFFKSHESLNSLCSIHILMWFWLSRKKSQPNYIKLFNRLY